MIQLFIDSLTRWFVVTLILDSLTFGRLMGLCFDSETFHFDTLVMVLGYLFVTLELILLMLGFILGFIVVTLGSKVSILGV